MIIFLRCFCPPTISWSFPQLCMRLQSGCPRRCETSTNQTGMEWRSLVSLQRWVHGVFLRWMLAYKTKWFAKTSPISPTGLYVQCKLKKHRLFCLVVWGAPLDNKQNVTRVFDTVFVSSKGGPEVWRWVGETQGSLFPRVWSDDKC